jgi:NADH dehydrogenase
MATIGRYSAVVQRKDLKFHGFFGWLGWLFLHLLYIAGFRSKLITLVDWGWDYLLQDRPVRLILSLGDKAAADRDPGPAAGRTLSTPAQRTTER